MQRIRYTDIGNLIFGRDVMKNSMLGEAMISTRVISALVSLGQLTSHLLKLLPSFHCHAIYYLQLLFITVSKLVTSHTLYVPRKANIDERNTGKVGVG